MKLFFEKIGAKRILSLVLSAVMLFAIVLFASSCERGVQVQNISLNFSEINIIVGSSRMISGSDITFEPVLVRNRDFVLISGDNSIFTACNNTSSVTALRAGRARLTVQSVSNGRVAVAYVNVSDRAPEKIEVISNGEIFQSALSFSTIEFFAHLDTDLANIVMVNWRIHDIQTGVEYENITLTSYESFSFLPHRVGAFEITASVFNHFNQEISHSVRVGAFYDFVLAPQYFEHIMGELFQETRQEVSFEVDFVDAHGNPPRTIEWMVGEEVMSVERRFNFFPQQSGQFQISLYINGKRISFSTGENYALLVVEDVDGAIPTNLYLCTFRNFPYVTLYFDTSIINVDYEIRIYRETSDGARTSHAVNISTINTATQGVFQNGYADLTEFVGFNESENFHVLNTTFIVRIRTMLRGERDGISEWVEISSNPIRDYQNAIPHLKNTAFDGHQNHFVQNENDFAKLFAHFFKWREMPRLGNNVSHSQTHEMFICDDFGAPFIYPFVGDSVELTNNITSFLRHNFYALGFTGYYRIEFEFGSNNGQGRIFSLTIRFDTDGLPSFSSDIFHWPSSVGGQAPIALRALRPRVNNDFSNLRQSLPIDSSGRREVLVRTSEQLYFVLERGFRPIVERGSEAYSIYHQAREVMKSIVPNNNSWGQVEVLQAIYDWLIWRTSFDHRAWESTGDNTVLAVRQQAFYLEGIFNDDERGLAVCDGIAKAFILLAGLENIQAVRVIGDAYVGFGRWGPHAWNKVQVYGKWFIVDATWGLETTRFEPIGGGRMTELQNRRWFLLTDRETFQTHRERSEANFPPTSIRPINAHARSFSSSNSSLSFYVTGSIAHSSKSAKMLVDYMIETVENAQRTFQVGFANEFLQYRQTIGFSDFIAFEIRINRSLENVFAFKQNSVSISQDDVENPFLERFRYHGFNYFNMPVPDQEHRSVYFKITNSTDIQSPQGAMFVQIIIAI